MIFSPSKDLWKHLPMHPRVPSWCWLLLSGCGWGCAWLLFVIWRQHCNAGGCAWWLLREHFPGVQPHRMCSTAIAAGESWGAEPKGCLFLGRIRLNFTQIWHNAKGKEKNLHGLFSQGAILDFLVSLKHLFNQMVQINRKNTKIDVANMTWKTSRHSWILEPDLILILYWIG